MAFSTKRTPKEFNKYFWDTDFNHVINRPTSKFTLERIMNFGNLKALRWLLNYVPKKAILNVLKTSRDLEPKTRNFWQMVYGK
jgi:hypothetical protein